MKLAEPYELTPKQLRVNQMLNDGTLAPIGIAINCDLDTFEELKRGLFLFPGVFAVPLLIDGEMAGWCTVQSWGPHENVPCVFGVLYCQQHYFERFEIHPRARLLIGYPQDTKKENPHGNYWHHN